MRNARFVVQYLYTYKWTREPFKMNDKNTHVSTILQKTQFTNGHLSDILSDVKSFVKRIVSRTYKYILSKMCYAYNTLDRHFSYVENSWCIASPNDLRVPNIVSPMGILSLPKLRSNWIVCKYCQWFGLTRLNYCRSSHLLEWPQLPEYYMYTLSIWYSGFSIYAKSQTNIIMKNIWPTFIA